VSAKDRGTGQEQKIQITSSSGISDSEIKNMVEQAKTHASDDQTKRRQIETRNRLDSLIYSTEKLVADNRDKLPAAESSAVDEAVSEAKKALEEGSTQEMERAHERLTQASHQVAAVLYQSAQGQGGAAGQQPGGAGGNQTSAAADDDVIDAEYVDVDAEEKN
jgi:molecular chaperone DnaK